jgi:hypothetical protein
VPALGVAVVQPACTSLDGLTRRSSDGGGESTECAHATVVPPPNVTADVGGSIDFVVAASAYDIGDVDTEAGARRYRSMGYDLDGKCTGLGDGPSCIKPSWVTFDERDGPQGQDNIMGALLYRAADGGTNSTQSANSSIDAGRSTLVIRVRGYNGTSVDPEVEVAVYGATMNSGGAVPDVRPQWLGEDEWAALGQWVDRDPTGELNVDYPKYVDAGAYVNNWRLVAQFDRYRIPLYVLSQVKLSARMLWQDERWHLVEGSLGGRMKTDEVLWASDLLQDPETGGPLCTNSPSYATTKQTLCGTSDISYTGPDDGTMPCDATSWGWAFETKPARLKGVFVQGELPRICPPETSSFNDSCSTLGAQ